MSLIEEFAANAESAGFVVHREEVPQIDGAGVSHAVYALADTGSVVLAASPEEPRAASLLPDVHITLVSENVILAGLEELFAAVGDDLPSSLAIVTGPEPQRGHRAEAHRRRPRPRGGARRDSGPIEKGLCCRADGAVIAADDE